MRMPIVDAVIPSAEAPAAPEDDATAPTAAAVENQEAPEEESAPQETVSESKE